MNKRKKNTLFFLAAGLMLFTLTGCSKMALPDPLATETGDYGAFPVNYENMIKDYFGTRLKDPYSAVYRYPIKPYKAYLREAPVKGGAPVRFGYVVEVGVNAKNGWGGYTGEKRYKLFVENGVILMQMKPNSWFPERWYQ